ncbi:MAG: T9SS type A sorting domain-containing protein [Bacteroidetes bacterium]|nr:T9SS type A sorting domain-containing protein [Bacteroidota bacterium]
MKKNYTWKAAALAATLITGSGLNAQVSTFNYTGAVQTYTVPAGVTLIAVDVYGADGYGAGGLGGRVQANMPVVPGEVLEVYVGGAGTPTLGGFNGGGNAGSITTYGGGGGASDIRQGGSTLADRVIVAGGGGGTGSNCGTDSAPGGHGGGLIGESGCLYFCSSCQYTGAGGTQSAGGIAGPTAHGSCGGNQDGSFGQGGSNTTGGYGTGGGGGYYGGGSGCFEGAGGGSSYTYPMATAVVHTQGVQSGNGMITITPLCDGLTTTVSATSLCLGESFTVTASSTNGGTISWDNGVTDGVAYTPAAVGVVTYTASSTSVDDCPFSVDIEVFDVPSVTAMADNTEICLGETVTFTAGGTADSYIWDNGVTDGIAFTPAASGTVTYTATGTITATGCDNTASVDVTVYDPIAISFVATDEMSGNDGTINITVTGGNPAYTFDWDNDGTGDTDDTEDLSGLVAGTYIVVVDDQSSCASEADTITIASQVGISEEDASAITLYPNPTSDMITIEYQGAFTYVLTSVTGELVLSGSATNKEVLLMSHLADGTYFVTINNNTLNTIRVVKK